MSDTEFNRLAEWVGRTEVRHDGIDAARAQGLAAALGRADAGTAAFDAGGVLPPLWHWLYFWPQAPRGAMGADGHPRLGGFMPPIALPRRMWAGSRVTFHHDVPIGAPLARETTIADIQSKSGRSGALVFVQLRHAFHHGGQLAITDAQDIVYRAPAAPGAAASTPQPAPPDPAWLRDIVPDEVLLFRYSALTFNAHRIHYDLPYATQQEGYAGLVVHGPLMATLMLEHLRDRLAEQQPDRTIRTFSFRALNPLLHTDRFAVCAQPDGETPNAYALWVRRGDGALCMQGHATVD